jgi:hypothetical protein
MQHGPFNYKNTCLIQVWLPPYSNVFPLRFCDVDEAALFNGQKIPLELGLEASALASPHANAEE